MSSLQQPHRSDSRRTILGADAVLPKARRESTVKSKDWKSSLSRYADGVHFAIGICEVLALRVVGFGSLLYLLYKVVSHL
jgi:hypothetical protein